MNQIELIISSYPPEYKVSIDRLSKETGIIPDMSNILEFIHDAEDEYFADRCYCHEVNNTPFTT